MVVVVRTLVTAFANLDLVDLPVHHVLLVTMATQIAAHVRVILLAVLYLTHVRCLVSARSVYMHFYVHLPNTLTELIYITHKCTVAQNAKYKFIQQPHTYRWMMFI